MANLTKRDLVVSISEKTGLIQQDVFSVIQLTLDGITEALSNGQGVELREFGVFRTRLTKQRVGRNPKKLRASHGSADPAIIGLGSYYAYREFGAINRGSGV